MAGDLGRPRGDVSGPAERVVVHRPIWPNIPNAAQLRGAVVEQIDLDALPDGGFHLDLDRLDTMMAGARAFILNSPGQPDRLDRDTSRNCAAIRDICRRHGAWLIADEVYSRLVYDGRPPRRRCWTSPNRTTASSSATASPRPG